MPHSDIVMPKKIEKAVKRVQTDMFGKVRKHFQPDMFAKPVPRMPEGYYSGDKPNPNLKKFVEDYAKNHPSDPDTDSYDVPPFDQPIKSAKATAINNKHTRPPGAPEGRRQRARRIKGHEESKGRSFYCPSRTGQT